MVGTIEPRLLAPFNEPSWEPYPRLDLPPIQYSDGLTLPSRPLTLEPLAPRNAQQPGLARLQGLDLFDGETAIGQYGFEPSALISVPKSFPRPTRVTSSQSLRKILADEGDPPQTTPRKRQRKDEFMKLPQPEKKQKGSQQVVQPLVPPIIVGIHEPPPNQASTFLPMNTGPLYDSHGRSALNTPSDETRQIVDQPRPKSPVRQIVQPAADIQPATEPSQDEQPAETTVRTVQARNKWSEEETKQLLLGVQRHGIGNWTKILDDEDFKFNNRRAVHLKDRFRTCFPDGCEGPAATGSYLATREPPNSSRRDPGGSQELSSQQPSVPDLSITPPTSKASAPSSEPKPPKKSKAHRKNLEDLKEIGIVKPFSKSRRRQRRAFTEEEDRNILLGFQKYGQSSWTSIQRDPALGLDSRSPTDIRDRFRNRYPDKHKEILNEEVKEDLGKGALRTVVSIEELLDPDVDTFASSAPSLQPIQIQTTDQFLPPINFQTHYPDILSSTTRLPKMSFTELLRDPLPSISMLGEPFSFPDWADTAPFGNDEFWMLPEIQSQVQQPSARQNRGVYPISSICEAVEPYAHNLGG